MSNLSILFVPVYIRVDATGLLNDYPQQATWFHARRSINEALFIARVVFGKRQDVRVIGVNEVALSDKLTVVQFIPCASWRPIPPVVPQIPKTTKTSLSDHELRTLWRLYGGTFHGPRIETGMMPEAKLLPFLRSLYDRIAQAGNP